MCRMCISWEFPFQILGFKLYFPCQCYCYFQQCDNYGVLYCLHKVHKRKRYIHIGTQKNVYTHSLSKSFWYSTKCASLEAHGRTCYQINIWLHSRTYEKVSYNVCMSDGFQIFSIAVLLLLQGCPLSTLFGLCNHESNKCL